MAEPLNLEALKAWAKWAPNPTYPEDAKGRLIGACDTIQDLIAEIKRLRHDLAQWQAVGKVLADAIPE